MNDAVLTYHTNPMTCGVARFNQQLAERLMVPCYPIATSTASFPLVSVKPSEIPSSSFTEVSGTYDLFLHDWQATDRNLLWVSQARTVYAANTVIWRELHPFRPDTVLAWCPGMIQGRADTGYLKLLLFGMGHKVQVDKLTRLKRLLDRSGYDYTVHVSSMIHEGQPFNEAYECLVKIMSGLFRDRLRLLGLLADDALASVMRKASAVGLFYEQGVRANNTTLWAAMDAGKPVITNLDQDSPPELVHGKTVFDLLQMRKIDETKLEAVGIAGQQAAKGRSWPRLLSVLMT